MTVLTIIGYYLLIGGGFGLAFFLRGYAVIDPAAQTASIFLRMVWTPAAIALWPLLVIKWWQQSRSRTSAKSNS